MGERRLYGELFKWANFRLIVLARRMDGRESAAFYILYVYK